MMGHTFFGKRRLCYTDVLDYTNYQGIGHDPLYKRYDSVYSVIKKSIAPEYQHFLATPQYVHDEDQICWYIDEWTEIPLKITDLSEKQPKKVILVDHNSYEQSAVGLEESEIIEIIEIRFNKKVNVV